MSLPDQSAFSIRGATSDDWETISRLDERAFGFTASGDRDSEREIFEFDRTVLAVADGREVGLGSVFSLRMSVPGGQLLPTAGVTWVGVLATHRRRGVLTAMMRKLLDDAREHGRPGRGVVGHRPRHLRPVRLRDRDARAVGDHPHDPRLARLGTARRRARGADVGGRGRPGRHRHRRGTRGGTSGRWPRAVDGVLERAPLGPARRPGRPVGRTGVRRLRRRWAAGIRGLPHVDRLR